MKRSQLDSPNQHEEVVEARPLWAWLGAPLALAELVAAGTLCWTLLARHAVGECSGQLACGVLYLIIVVPGSVLGALLLFVVHNHLFRDMRARLKVDALLALCVLVWWNATQRVEENQARIEQQQEQTARAMERASAGTEDHYARNRFLESLRRFGNHGPPGQVPGVLRVQDDGMEAEVELLDSLQEQLPVALARVLPDAGAATGWRGCPMQASDAVAQHGAFALRPNQPVRFVPAAGCAAQFRDAPLEFRVGTWKLGSAAPGWWSDSALAVPDGWPEPAASSPGESIARPAAPADPDASEAPIAVAPPSRGRRQRP